MTNNKSIMAKSAALQSLEIAFVAPQVIAHRIIRMANAGPTPSTRDRREFQLMGMEKLAAMIESWNAMTFATGLIIQALAIQQMTSMTQPCLLMALGSSPATIPLSMVGPNILSSGIAPFHRRVIANAKRLEYAI
jgi:hypothetical protein